MIGALARPSIARVMRGRRTWIALAAWSGLALALALTARERGAARGADHVLIETYGAFVLPLVAYAIVGAALASRSLRASAAPLVAFGATPARAAAATIGVSAVACAIGGAILAAAVALIAHGVADPPRVPDAVASAYAGAMGGAAYAAWFSLGATFGRRGGGRTAFLLVDWILGATGGGGALAVPRGHLRNLLGGAPPMDLSEKASAAILWALVLAYTLLAIRRTRA